MMKIKTSRLPLYFLLTALFMVVLVSVLRRGESGSEGKCERPDTVIHYRVDTVYDTISITKYYPKPVKDEVLRIDTVYADTLLATKRSIYCDTILATPTDTVCVMTEIEGIDARMNYLKAYLKKGTITEHTEKTITVVKKKKGFMIAPTVGVGYGIFNKRPDVYIGVGFSYFF